VAKKTVPDVTDPVVVGPSIELEDGSTVAVPVEVSGQRTVTVGPQTYEVCATRPDGTWVYRAVRF
jgi:hypothetical protein